MTPVRIGAVGYLNARPHVFGLDDSPQVLSFGQFERKVVDSLNVAVAQAANEPRVPQGHEEARLLPKARHGGTKITCSRFRRGQGRPISRRFHR